MAPEQLEGLATDWRIDVFAFGAILYEMVTARKAFAGGPGPGRDRICRRTRRLAAGRRAAVDARPDAVHRSLSGSRRRRPLDAHARHGRRAAPHLDRVDRGRADPAGCAVEPATRRLVAGRRGCRSVVIGRALVGRGSRELVRPRALPPAADTSSAPLSLGNMRLVTADDRLEVDPTFSPDGQSVAYAAGTATGMRIFVRALGEGRTRPLTDEPGRARVPPALVARRPPDPVRHTRAAPSLSRRRADPPGGSIPRPTRRARTRRPRPARRDESSAARSGRPMADAWRSRTEDRSRLSPADGVGERRRIGSLPVRAAFLRLVTGRPLDCLCLG